MYQFYGQFDPPVDRVLFERYFPDRNIRGTFVECGAYDGLVESSCKFFEETLGWTGYNLEPSPPNFRALQRNRPRSRNLPIGLSNQDGRASFMHAISPVHGEGFGNGSIQHTSAHLEALKNEGCTFERYEIEVMRWDSFVKREGVTHVDLFVLDVEGHEMQVIEGMHGCPVLPDILCIEVGHLSFDEVRSALARLGYVYDIGSHVNAFFIKAERVALFALRRLDFFANPR